MTTCVRQAWLTMGSQSIALENTAAGYFCQSLDLGYPEVRDVMSNRPDQDGVDDRSQFFGARTVTAAITALRGAGAQIDAVASSFAPYMQPSARPVLHYILDRPGAAERTITLRASGYSWPVVGADQRDIQLQWVAADPRVYDPTQRTATAWSGASGAQGRTYNLTFNRIYPPGGGSSTTAYFTSAGDLKVWPLLRIYGPVSGPIVSISFVPSATYPDVGIIAFRSSYVISAGQWVDVDAARRTAYANSDRTQNVLNQIDWSNTVRWPYIIPLPATAVMGLRGQNTSGVTQVQAIWQDAYLT